jgi:hypothetical protein
MERLSKLPTRQELALRPLYVIAGSADSSSPGSSCSDASAHSLSTELVAFQGIR